MAKKVKTSGKTQTKKSNKSEKQPKTLPANVSVEVIEIKGKPYMKVLIPIEIKESSTGKSEILATTGGNCLTELDYQGRDVYFGCVSYSPYGESEE